jgi:hypothetical protein
VSRRKKLPTTASPTKALSLAEGWYGLAATQSRIARMQIEALQRSQKLALDTLNATAPLWQPLMMASLKGPTFLPNLLRGPWAR